MLSAYRVTPTAVDIAREVYFDRDFYGVLLLLLLIFYLLINHQKLINLRGRFSVHYLK